MSEQEGDPKAPPCGPVETSEGLGAAGGGASGGGSGTAAPPAPERASVSYDGRMAPLAGIAVMNAILTLATFGIYRFWGKTRLRRYIWSRISLLGDRLEYSGTGKELFLGFLIAMVFLIPVFVVPAVLQALSPNNLELQAVVGVLQGLVILFLIQVALYRARRYRLSRTQWRGLRGGQGGSGFKYALMAFALYFLALVTLLLAYPWARVALQRYKTENTWLGDRALSFRGSGAELLKAWIIPWGIFFLVIAATIVVVWMVAPAMALNSNPNALGAVFFPLGILLLVGFFAWVWYQVEEFRYFISRTSLEESAFQSTLSTGRVIWIHVLFFFAMLAVLFIFGALAGGSVLALYGLEIQAMSQAFEGGGDLGAVAGSPALVILLILLLLALSVLFSVVRIVFWLQPMAKAIAGSISVENPETFETLAQSRQEMPGRGEGLADTLDVAEVGF